jgi:type II secretory pathway pseudopilin PulG
VLRRLRSERGDTYIELIVSTALLGILGVGMLTALSSTIIVSNADRGYAGIETVLRSYATTLERRPYKPCTAGSSANPYTASDLAFSAPTGYTATVTSVKFLTKAGNTNNISSSSFGTTCPTGGDGGGDQGAQQFAIKVSKTGSASQTATIIMRKGNS